MSQWCRYKTTLGKYLTNKQLGLTDYLHMGDCALKINYLKEIEERYDPDDEDVKNGILFESLNNYHNYVRCA